MIPLSDPLALRPEIVGRKAAGLARMMRAGLPVPDGFVVPAASSEIGAESESGGSGVGAEFGSGGSEVGAQSASDMPKIGVAKFGSGGRDAVPFDPQRAGAIQDAAGLSPAAQVRLRIERAGEGARWAVRSSAVAEDLPDASFAGMYASIVDVQGADEVLTAIASVVSSAATPAVARYRSRNDRAGAGMAVLIQCFIAADVSGVAFGADPVTGDRTAVAISAVRGVGVPLVGGSAEPAANLLTPDETERITAMTRRIGDLEGGPQDIEWALCNGELFVLQVRPMTGLPPPVTWAAPGRGGWFRDIRLGEWLPEPVTALCETWLLPGLEERIRVRQQEDGGFRIPGRLHALVNGWYFHSPLGDGGQFLLLRGLFRRPRLAIATVAGRRYPRLAERLFARRLADRWRTEFRPGYEQAVAEAEKRIDTATPAQLVDLIDGLIAAAGDCFWSAILAGGAAWRAEVAVLRHFGPDAHGLLRGEIPPRFGPHTTFSLDWVRPTLGELDLPHGLAHVPDSPADCPRDPAYHTNEPRSQANRPVDAGGSVLPPRAGAERISESSGLPTASARARRALDAARRAVRLRQEHSEAVTLAWPLLRRAVLCLGGPDAFHQTRDELLNRETVDTPARRREWEGQRRLTPPDILGRPPFLLRRMLLPRRLSPTMSETVLQGHSTSPGRATGPVHIIRDPSDLSTVKGGEVLVAAAAVPALTVTFGIIAALCVDSGSAAAHAAVVAREYAIPAVTGLGDATARLKNGQIVTVDGTRGVVAL